MRRAAALGAAVIAMASATACGSGNRSGAPGRPVLNEREWVDNAAFFADSLGTDVLLTANGGSNVASAQAALRDQHALYAMLVAYTAFDDCGRTLTDLGPPATKLRPVAQELAAACRGFEHASALFTVAVRRSSATWLLAATQTTLAASPSLYDARTALEALGASAAQ
jgi:hypothetical protein